jgi:hypothetical protein
MEKEMIQQIADNANHCVEYKGQITVSIFEDDRLISKNTYNNKGTNKLFAFLTNCLSGDFNTARASRPCRLVLLKKGSEENLTTSTPLLTNKDSGNNPYWGEYYYVAPPVYYGKTPVITGNKITYSFRVPFLILQNGAIIKKMALVPENSSSVSDICAYYILGTEIEVPTAGGNYTILVD